jgi:undecaprenyl diphosphate synthase
MVVAVQAVQLVGLPSPLSLRQVPTHVAIIMDGNGRWARHRGLPRLAGHRAGTENIRRVIQRFADYGVRCLTLFAFSTENWARPKPEVQGLMGILRHVIRRETQYLHEEGIRLLHIGRPDGLSARLRREVREAIELTKDNDRMTLCVAFNYGGRAEILDAVRRLIADGVMPEAVDEALFASYLYTEGSPDPDLIIRTGGEMRVSNFLIWQAAYAEFYCTEVYWPDFDVIDIDKALLAFSERQRRFGGLRPEEGACQPLAKRHSLRNGRRHYR